MVKLEELDYDTEVCVCVDCGHVHDYYPHGIDGGEGSCEDCRSNSFVNYYYNADYGIYVNEDGNQYFRSYYDKIGSEIDQTYLDDVYSDNLYHINKER